MAARSIAGTVVLTALLTLVVTGCITLAKDEPPTRVLLPSYTDEEIGKAVQLALIQRGWELTHASGVNVAADLVQERERVSIVVTYGNGEATIRFVRGEQYAYREGKYLGTKPLNASAYRRWVANLAKDIPRLTQRVRVMGDNVAGDGLSEAKVPETSAPKSGTPAPQAQVSPSTIEERLKALKRTYDQGLITKDEYDSKRKALLNEL